MPHEHPIQAVDGSDSEIRKWASRVSLVVSLLILAVKFSGYMLTGSYAIFSDALESCVNVAGAIFALTAVMIASQPADQSHPYGHGKVEFFSAAFEGGLLTCAAFMIVARAIDALIEGSQLQRLDLGLALIVAAGVANALLGLYLLRTGKKHHSLALTASGRHVLSDFYTTIGVIAALFLVRLTGFTRIDPLVALGVGAYIGWTGFNLVRHSAGGLMDAQDQESMTKLGELFTKHLFPGIIRIHSTRIIRAGRSHHIDCHVVVPEYWSVAYSHKEVARFEKAVIDDYAPEAEIHFHIDPCRQGYCRVCDMPDCPIRRAPFEHRTEFTLDELTSPTEASHFQRYSLIRNMPS